MTPGGSLKRFHYSWIIAGVTFLTLLGASGFRSTPGVLIVPLQNEFGWSRTTISFAVSINLILYGLTGPFAAALYERFGIRRVVSTALIVVAIGSSLTTLMHAPWQLQLLWGVVIGLGTGSMATVLAATIANRWFVTNRGIVLGVLTAAGATGQLIFLPLLAWLATNHGWRWASMATAIGALSVLPLVLIFMRERPSDLGLARYGLSEREPRVEAVGSPFKNAINGLRSATHSQAFWLLAGTFFICGASTNGLIGTHLIPAGVDHGMTEVAAASLLALIGIFDIIGTTLSGWLTDRWDSRKLLFTYYALRGLSLMALPIVFNSPHFGLILFIVFYGLDWVATVPPTVHLTTKAFGRANAPIIIGWVFAAHQIGAASAASLAGLARTTYGNYSFAFIGAGALCLFAAVASLQIGKTPSPIQPFLPIAASPAG